MIYKLCFILIWTSLNSVTCQEFNGSSSTNPVAYTIEGTLTNTVLNPNGGVVSAEGCQFSISARGRAWKLVIFNFNEKQQSREFVCDGTNTVEIFRQPGFGTLPIPSTIHTEKFPAVGYYPDIVWLAYASSTYIQSGGKLVAPWLSPRDDPAAHVFEPVVSLLPGVPRLPSIVEFISRKDLIASAAEHPMLKQEGVSQEWRKALSKRVSSIHDGFRGAVYSVLSTTNIAGMTLPTQFELKNLYSAVKIPKEKATNAIPFPATNRVEMIGTRIVGTATLVQGSSAPIVSAGG